LLLPEGLPPDPRKISKFLTNPQRWNDGTRSASDPFASAADDVAFLDLAIAEAIQKSGADPSLVLLTGFSNGASMSYRYAVERADHLAAIAPVASYNPLPTARLRSPVPTLVLLGGSDPLIPYAGGMVRNPWGELRPRPAIRPGLDAWATALGCSSPAEILQSTAEIERFRYPGPVEYQVVIHRQLGHHWPGGKGQLGEEWGGPFVPVFPSAVEQIWDFFQTHILSKPPAPRESGKPTAG
jgi:polyhydroxybutyrate depolymerase